MMEFLDEMISLNIVEFELVVGKGVIVFLLNIIQEYFFRVLYDLLDCGLFEVKGKIIWIFSVFNLFKS